MASLVQSPSRGLTSSRYQAVLVGLLGVNLGVVFLDRTAFGLLAPMIQPEFKLDNTQIGLITGALAVTWSLSSFGLTRAADLTGRSRVLLVAATVIFSLASISWPGGGPAHIAGGAGADGARRRRPAAADLSHRQQ